MERGRDGGGAGAEEGLLACINKSLLSTQRVGDSQLFFKNLFTHKPTRKYSTSYTKDPLTRSYTHTRVC